MKLQYDDLGETHSLLVYDSICVRLEDFEGKSRQIILYIYVFIYFFIFKSQIEKFFLASVKTLTKTSTREHVQLNEQLQHSILEF